MKIGLLCEGKIDFALIPALVQRIARCNAGIRWPVRPDDVVEQLRIRGSGHGQVRKAVERLCSLLDEGVYADYAFFLVVLDHKRPAELKLRSRGASEEKVTGAYL